MKKFVLDTNVFIHAIRSAEAREELAAWQRASRIVSRLAEDGEIDLGGVKPSFYNDCLLAASAREHGYDLITYNRTDFEMISLAEPAIRCTPPFP